MPHEKPQQPQTSQSFSFWGMTIPLTKGNASLLGIVIVVAVAAFLYQQIWAKPEQQVLTLKQMNDQLAADVEEYGQHAMEDPKETHELFEDTDGGMKLRVYPDHCVLIQRKTRNEVLTRLVPDLARTKAPRKAELEIEPSRFPVLFPVLEAQGVCNRGCLNPHPGQFQWWYGNPLPGGWVQVWRRWPEGCTHWQAFHPQSGSWATLPSGAPDVKWTCCVH